MVFTKSSVIFILFLYKFDKYIYLRKKEDEIKYISALILQKNKLFNKNFILVANFYIKHYIHYI